MAKTKTTTYRNQGGGHALADGTIIGYKEVFECDDPDLCKKFPNKFVKVHPGDVVDVPTKDDPQDVTAEWDVAGDNDLRVLRDKKGWWVYDDGEDPINDKPLKKKDVDEAIETYLED